MEENWFDTMLNNTKKWLSGNDVSGTPNILNALGIAGGVYSGYKQQRLANEQLKQQKAVFDFNKMLSQRQFNMQNQAQQNLIKAWQSSSFNNPFLKKEKDDENA